MRHKRTKVGRRVVTPPSVKSMTSDTDPPATKPGDGAPDKPTDELSEELARTIKAAYQ
jgi:hypothetical protein